MVCSAMVAGTQQLQGFYRKYSQVLLLENTTFHWSGSSLLVHDRKEGRKLKWIERHGRSKGAEVLSVLHSCLHSSGGFSRGLRTGKPPGALIPRLFVQPDGLEGSATARPRLPGQDVLPETCGCPWDIWDPVLEQGISLNYNSEL